jgi:hypothetical protein
VSARRENHTSSVNSSTETLLKPGVPLQTRGMLSAQQTAEKQKPVFFHHFKKTSTDSPHSNSFKSQK